MRGAGDLFDGLAEQCRQRWQPLGFTTRTVSANDIDLHVAEGGSGRPLVLLHGYPQSGEIWRARSRPGLPSTAGSSFQTCEAWVCLPSRQTATNCLISLKTFTGWSRLWASPTLT